MKKVILTNCVPSVRARNKRTLMFKSARNYVQPIMCNQLCATKPIKQVPSILS